MKTKRGTNFPTTLHNMRTYAKQGQYQQIVKAKLLIETNYMDKLTIDRLADEAHFSKFHFVRLFKNIYGITPLQCLTKVRIKAAKKLMESGITLTDACWQVGFESISSFMALFKEKTGKSSTLYKNEVRRHKKMTEEKPTQIIPSCLINKSNVKKSNNEDIAHF